MHSILSAIQSKPLFQNGKIEFLGRIWRSFNRTAEKAAGSGLLSPVLRSPFCQSGSNLSIAGSQRL